MRKKTSSIISTMSLSCLGIFFIQTDALGSVLDSLPEKITIQDLKPVTFTYSAETTQGKSDKKIPASWSDSSPSSQNTAWTAAIPSGLEEMECEAFASNLRFGGKNYGIPNKSTFSLNPPKQFIASKSSAEIKSPVIFSKYVKATYIVTLTTTGSETKVQTPEGQPFAVGKASVLLAVVCKGDIKSKGSSGTGLGVHN